MCRRRGESMNLAWKEIQKSKGRYGVIVLVLMATMYLVFFTMSLSLGLRHQAGSKLMSAPMETYILSQGSNGNIARSTMSSDYGEKILSALGDPEAFILGVRLSSVENLTRETEADVVDITYFSIPPGETAMNPTLVEGRFPEGPNEVLASEHIVNDGIQLGDDLQDDRVNTRFKVVGLTKKETHSYNPIIYTLPEKYIDTSFWGQVTGYAEVQAVVTELSTEEINDEVRALNVDIHHKDTIIQNLPGLLAQTASFILLIIAMYIISATIIGMFFYIINMDKREEFGLLKAFGASDKMLTKMVIRQVLMVAVISVVLSVTLIILTSVLLPSIVPFYFVPEYILGGSIAFVLIALLGSLASLRTIRNVDPAEIMGGRH